MCVNCSINTKEIIAPYIRQYIFTNSESEYKINQLYKQKTNEDIDGPALEEFASAVLIVDAINSAISLKGEDIIRVLKTKEFSTPYFISKSIKFNQNGQNMMPISFMVQIQNGKYEVVWPLNIQEKAPQVLGQ